MLPTQNMAIPCNYCHLFQIFNTLLLLELLIAVCADVLWESGARDTAHLLRIASAMSAFLSGGRQSCHPSRHSLVYVSVMSGIGLSLLQHHFYPPKTLFGSAPPMVLIRNYIWKLG